MKKLFLVLGLLFILTTLSACGGGGGGADVVTETVPGETVTNTVTENNNIPVANAGADQTSAVGNVITLDGTGSSDLDGNPLTYKWNIVSVPSGSSLNALGDDTSVISYVGFDVAGDYVFQLTVNDGLADSQPDTVTVTVNALALTNLSPADGATGASTATKLSWEFNGTSSPKYDVYFSSFNPPALVSYQQTAKDFSPGTLSLGTTYYWKIIGYNYDGTYSVSTSVMSFTTTTSENQPPTANAGADQSVETGSTVTLDGSGSTDPEGSSLTYSWSFSSLPTGSAATLSSATTVNPTFTADVAGTYVVSLTVNDGSADSSADTVSITATDMTVGDEVILYHSGYLAVWNAVNHFDISSVQSYLDGGGQICVAGSFNSWSAGYCGSAVTQNSDGSWTFNIASLGLADGNYRYNIVVTDSGGTIVGWMHKPTFSADDQATFFVQAPNGDWGFGTKIISGAYTTIPAGETIPQSPSLWKRLKKR